MYNNNICHQCQALETRATITRTVQCWEFNWLYLIVINEETSIISIDLHTSLFYLRLMIMAHCLPHTRTHKCFSTLFLFTSIRRSIWLCMNAFCLCKWNKFRIHLYDAHTHTPTNQNTTKEKENQRHIQSRRLLVRYSKFMWKQLMTNTRIN